MKVSGETKFRTAFVMPTTIFLMIMTLTILLIQLMTYESTIYAQRNERKYWQIQTIVNEVSLMQARHSQQTSFSFHEGQATLKNSQIKIILASGETASYQVWERKHNLK
ncbi:hypothetical protein LROSL1_1721 [Furfurilactobacillus rossiae]|uniref:hypothetical protein n=1 Tax=Furfurilactobacillus rossiae TaxID=231049 RepID=UPI0015BA6E4C|nr:hypothetical protein [Furfurilactobacillus rossiae]MCF6166557.1 hypothetical protein [Furfurilactobacillus rossiae]QLE64537.1 hypothetical protein LROSL1_1721 [Furfurilactobacillus rossiae]